MGAVLPTVSGCAAWYSTRRLRRAENVQGVFSSCPCAHVLQEPQESCCSASSLTCVPIAPGASSPSLASQVYGCLDFSSAVLHTQTCLTGTCSAAPIALCRFFCFVTSCLSPPCCTQAWGSSGRMVDPPFYLQAQGWCCAPEEGSPRKKKIRKSVIDWPEHSSHITHPFCFLKRFTQIRMCSLLSNRWSSIWATVCFEEYSFIARVKMFSNNNIECLPCELF